jgi:hypothetical protein
MESYQDFLLYVVNTVARTHLCSQAVQNQVMALYGGKSAFQKYVKAHPDKFFSALKVSDLWYKAKVSLGAKRVSRQEVSSVALNSHKISYD